MRLVASGIVVVTLLLVAIGFILQLELLRGISVSFFLLVCLGVAPVLLLGPLSGRWFVLLSVTVSLATTTALGFAMSLTHLWFPEGMFIFVVVATAALLLPSVAQDVGRIRGVTAVTAATALPAPADETGRRNTDSKQHSAKLSTPENLAWVAILDDGRRLQLTEPLVLGRLPKGGPHGGVRTVQLDDGSRTMSNTHLQIGVDSDGVFIIDLNSLNGVFVTNPDGVSVPCSPSSAARVGPGSVVSFGDRWLTIEQAS